MKKILIIGGGKWQVPIVKKAKELGLFVICTNLYENSPAFQYSDCSYVVDVLNKDENLKIAKKHCVEAVITDQSDIAVNTVAYINEKLKLNGPNIHIANLFTNKFAMRESIKLNNLYHPKYKLCKNIKDLILFYNEIKKTIIIKPISSQSSRGIKVINTFNDLEEAYKYTINFCDDKKFIAEEFIEGIELTVEGYKFLDQTHQTFAVSKKTYYQNLIGIANSLIYQPRYSEFNINEIKNINNQLFYNLSYGITHVEYKYNNGKFYLIEAAIRGGGTKISSTIIPAVSGYDVNYFLIKNALNEKIEFTKNTYINKYVVLKFFNFTNGVVKEIIGINKIKNLPDILDFELEFTKGDTISLPTDDRSRIGYFIAKADNLADLNKIISFVDKTIQVKVENKL